MKNICKAALCFILLLMILSACADETKKYDEDEQSINPPTENVFEEALNNISLPSDSNVEYVLFSEIYQEDTEEYEYALLNKDFPSLISGKEYSDDFFAKYDKGYKSQIQSITTDGKYIVFAEYPNDNDCTIAVYEELNLIFTNTVKRDSYVLSEMDYAINPDDYTAALTSILRSGYSFSSYPSAKVMIDIYSEKMELPIGVSDACNAYLLDECDYNIEVDRMTYFVYSYPDSELITSFKFPNTAASSTDEIIIEQFVDKQHILYTIRDTSITYLLDLSSNNATELGHDMWTPKLSPDGKYLAYANNWRDSQQVIYILDLENSEIYYYELGEKSYPRIIGWAEKTNIVE